MKTINPNWVPKIGEKVIITKGNVDWKSPEMDEFISQVHRVREVIHTYSNLTRIFLDDPKTEKWNWTLQYSHVAPYKEPPTPSERKKLKIKLKF